ncbi:MAG TPA: hypothetical protein VF486_21715, partial [Actinomycetes bacterium]
PPLAGVARFDSGDVVPSLVFLAFVAMGALIVTRRPGNRIGWLFCAIGLPVLLGGFATQYAVTALLARRPALPAGPAMAWLAGWASVVGVSLFFYLLVLFPDGHLPSRRWRGVAWLYGGALAVGLATAALQPGTTSGPAGLAGPASALVDELVYVSMPGSYPASRAAPSPPRHFVDNHVASARP